MCDAFMGCLYLEPIGHIPESSLVSVVLFHLNLERSSRRPLFCALCVPNSSKEAQCIQEIIEAVNCKEMIFSTYKHAIDSDLRSILNRDYSLLV